MERSISRKWYSIGEVLKHIFFWNPGIAKVLAVEREVNPRNMNFAKVQKKGGGGGGERLIGSLEFVRINMVHATRFYWLLINQCWSGLLCEDTFQGT